MSNTPTSVETRDRVVKSTIVILTIIVTLAFLGMIRDFLVALFLAAVFSGMAYPLYGKLLKLFRGRRAIASLVTLSIVVTLVLIPLAALLLLVAAQAFELSQSVLPWLEELAAKDPKEVSIKVPEWLPFRERIENPDPEVVKKLGEFGSQAASVVFSGLTSVTTRFFSFLINLFVMIYAMFWFLKEGPNMLEQFMQYWPLPRPVKDRIVEKGMSVTRATIKGTFVIGVIQGTLAGIAFAVVGIPGAAFWGTIMAVLSIIPGVGTALIWIPAAIYLFATGDKAAAIGLTAWCACVVGTVDNLLRPRLVGNDTKMSDLLILISTLGGLSFFGAVGIILGPTLAAVFITMWEAFRETFKGPTRSMPEHSQTWVPGTSYGPSFPGQGREDRDG